MRSAPAGHYWRAGDCIVRFQEVWSVSVRLATSFDPTGGGVVFRSLAAEGELVIRCTPEVAKSAVDAFEEYLLG